MSVHVFLGPSLSIADARRVLPRAIYHPPATVGDIYRVVANGDCSVLALIDGLFQSVPAVWHKEILFALERGLRVFGASSMGALRAAELDLFGMVGVGTVYGWYASGKLEGDDEVALVHGPKELGFPALSVPMVNVRRTLDVAHQAGWLSTNEREMFLNLAKSIHFVERTWKHLGESAAKQGIPASTIEHLIADGQRPENDVKRQDAELLLQHIAAGEGLETVWDHIGRSPVWQDFTLSRTTFWERFRAVAVGVTGTVEAGESVAAKDLRRFVMLTQGDGADFMDAAMLKALAEREAARLGTLPSRASLQAALDDFRRRAGLHTAADMHTWLAQCNATKNDFVMDVRARLVVAGLAQAVGPALDELFVGELKRRGRFDALLEEFVARRRFLHERGWMNPTLGDCGVDQEALDAWCRGRFGTLLRSAAGLEGETSFETRRDYLSEVLSQYLWEHAGRSSESSAREAH